MSPEALRVQAKEALKGLFHIGEAMSEPTPPLFRPEATEFQRDPARGDILVTMTEASKQLTGMTL